MISIHSPRAGRDSRSAVGNLPRSYFNPLAPCGARRAGIHQHETDLTISIHSPRAGRDALLRPQTPLHTVFQSTRPVRGETAKACDGMPPKRFQSTRPVRGETPQPVKITCWHVYFNPLAPRGARPRSSERSTTHTRFQSTRPAWGETRRQGRGAHQQGISIHSPRVGRDHVAAGSDADHGEISIHSPRVGRD